MEFRNDKDIILAAGEDAVSDISSEIKSRAEENSNNEDEEDGKRKNGRDGDNDKNQDGQEDENIKDAEAGEERKKDFGILVVDDGFEPENLAGFDVIAVHGIFSKREETWPMKEDSSWLKKCLKLEPSNTRIITFGYDTSNSKSGIYTLGRIREIAHELVDGLHEVRNFLNLDKRPLIFIGHDIGGIIIKEALCIASLKNPKFWNIKLKTGLMLFFGCPHRSNSLQDMEDKLANLIFSGSTKRLFGITSCLKELARSVVEINESFVLSKMPIIATIINVYSAEETEPLYNLDKHTATMDIPFEVQLSFPTSLAGKLERDRYTPIFSQHVATILDKTNGPLMPREDAINFMQNLYSSSTPLYPLEFSSSSEKRFSWIIVHKSYTQWLNCLGPSILYIHGTFEAAEASRFLFKALSSSIEADRKKRHLLSRKKKHLLYFAFDAHDSRRNSVMALLTSLLVQILNNNDEMYPMISTQVIQMRLFNSWSQPDLWYILTKLLTHWNHDGVICVIHGINVCEDSWTQFLRTVSKFAKNMERYFKVIFTETTDSVSQTVFHDWPSISLGENQEDIDISGLALDIERETLDLVQQQPGYYGFHDLIVGRLAKCGPDKHWSRLILSQLKLGQRPIDKFATLSQLELLPPTTPVQLFHRILCGVPLDQRSWGRKVITWTLYAFHPLTLCELSIALALKKDSACSEIRAIDDLANQDVASQLNSIFKGMFILENGCIRFGHPEAREFLLNATGKQEDIWYDVRDTAHRNIADTCLFYLSLQEVQNSISSSFVELAEGIPTLGPGYSLNHYSIKYWPEHYKRITKTEPMKSVVEFFQTSKAFQLWAEAYWHLTNPMSRSDKKLLSILPIFASIGLDDLLEKWLEDDSEIMLFGQVCVIALAEAARNSHVGTVNRLLELGTYNEDDLQYVLEAASSTCDEAVIIALIKYIAQRPGKFDWPPLLLCRVSQFGLTDVVESLLSLEVSFDTSFSKRKLTPIYLACRGGHTNVVKLLLDHGISALSTDPHMIPLMIASASGFADVVQLLLDHGADISCEAYSGFLPIDEAVRFGYYMVIDKLTKTGYDLNQKRQGGWSNLSIATYEGFFESTKVLLANDINPKTQGPEYLEAFRQAVVRGHLEICRLLLESKGYPEPGDTDIDTIFPNSVEGGNIELVDLLVKSGVNVNAFNSVKYNALLYASAYGYKDIVVYLLDNGADINSTNGDGQTSVFLAMSANHPNIVEVLAKRGADLNKSDTSGWPPVILSQESTDSTLILLENGAEVNCAITSDDGDFSGYTALHMAVSQGHLEAVKLLLSFGAKLDARIPEGSYCPDYTPLVLAIHLEEIGITRWLLSNGADINCRYANNNFPTQIAVQYDQVEILRMIMEFQPDLSLVDDYGSTALHWIDSDTSLETVKILVSNGAKLEIKDNYQYTPLSVAIQHANLEVLKYLAKISDVNVAGGEGSPLHLACTFSNLEVVKILIEAGADVNLFSPFSGTPLQVACRASDPIGDREVVTSEDKEEEIIRYLLDVQKADFMIEGGHFGCALNAACLGSNTTVVKLLLERGAKIDVSDGIGRVAIHFAALYSMSSFQTILDADGDVRANDKLGRTTVHWAAIGGIPEVLNRVISLSRGFVNQPDIDGWTPLHWAATGSNILFREEFPPQVELLDTVKLLLERGADSCLMGKGVNDEDSNRTWSPLDVAFFYNAGQAIIDLLTEHQQKTKDGDIAKESEIIERPKGSTYINWWCDCCLLNIRGISHRCEICFDFALCFKCYVHREIFHPNHTFELVGDMYASEEEVESSAISSDEGSSDEGEEEANNEKAVDSEDDENDEENGSEETKDDESD